MNRSFNRTDTSISVNGGRIKLHTNMKQRCQRIVSAMRALKRSGSNTLFVWEIVQKVQEMDPTHTYDRGDISRGIYKCVEDGTIMPKAFGGIHTYSLASTK